MPFAEGHSSASVGIGIFAAVKSPSRVVQSQQFDVAAAAAKEKKILSQPTYMSQPIPSKDWVLYKYHKLYMRCN